MLDRRAALLASYGIHGNRYETRKSYGNIRQNASTELVFAIQ
jgi:hypothetical protein